MKCANRSAAYVLALWASIAVVSVIASLLSYAVLAHFSAPVIAATEALAAGATFSMIADT